MKKYNFPLSLDIQFFAEPAAEPDAPEVPETPETPEEQPKKPEQTEKMFSKEEVEELVAKRVAREKKEVAKAIEEAEKLAKMNAEEKQKYEYEKLQREVEELRTAQNRNQMGKEASKMLSESNIVATEELLNLVVKDDAEQTKQAVEAFTALVTDLVDKAVKERLRGTPPRKPTGTAKVYTKQEIMDISDDFERKRLIAENMHLFKNK